MFFSARVGVRCHPVEKRVENPACEIPHRGLGHYHYNYYHYYHHYHYHYDYHFYDDCSLKAIRNALYSRVFAPGG